MTTSADSFMAFYDTRTSKSFFKINTGHEGRVYWAEYSSDGKKIATCGVDNNVRTWNTDTKDNKPKKLNVLQGHIGGIHHCRFNYNNTLIVSTSNEEEIAVHDLKGAMLDKYKLPKTTVEAELTEEAREVMKIN